MLNILDSDVVGLGLGLGLVSRALGLGLGLQSIQGLLLQPQHSIFLLTC